MSLLTRRKPTAGAMAIVCLASGLWMRMAAAQAPAPPALPDVQALGPQVGSRVPDFTLVDQHGQSRTLASLMGPKGLLLVFFCRSGRVAHQGSSVNSQTPH